MLQVMAQAGRELVSLVKFMTDTTLPVSLTSKVLDLAAMGFTNGLVSVSD